MTCAPTSALPTQPGESSRFQRDKLRRFRNIQRVRLGDGPPGRRQLVDRLRDRTPAGRQPGPRPPRLDGLAWIRGIQVSGWAVDHNIPTTPVGVGTFIGSATTPYKSVPVTATQLSPDVAAAFPRIGANHGFSATILARPGAQAVRA